MPYPSAPFIAHFPSLLSDLPGSGFVDIWLTCGDSGTRAERVSSRLTGGAELRRFPRRSAERPGVGGGVDLAQAVDGDQGVDLRRGHRGVPEQLLHRAHVRTALEQVRGVGVAQG